MSTADTLGWAFCGCLCILVVALAIAVLLQ